MTKRYSIAEARADLAQIVDEAVAGAEVELTRRGKPVAVVVSRQHLDRLRSERPTFAEAYRRFLDRYPLDGIDADEVFGGLRDEGAGRPVDL